MKTFFFLLLVLVAIPDQAMAQNRGPVKVLQEQYTFQEDFGKVITVVRQLAVYEVEAVDMGLFNFAFIDPATDKVLFRGVVDPRVRGWRLLDEVDTRRLPFVVRFFSNQYPGEPLAPLDKVVFLWTMDAEHKPPVLSTK